MFEEERLHVGGDVTAWCPVDEMVLTHSVVQAEKGVPIMVECNNCADVHRYQPYPPAATGRAHDGLQRAVQEIHPREEWEMKVKQRQQEGAPTIPYKLGVSLEPGDLLLHGKFGTGVVLKIISEEKVEVLFEDSVRVLVCCEL